MGDLDRLTVKTLKELIADIPDDAWIYDADSRGIVIIMPNGEFKYISSHE